MLVDTFPDFMRVWQRFVAADEDGKLEAWFLESSDSEEKTRRFFGHWYDLWGKRQCGYYLGHEVIARMEDADPLRTIALYPEPEKRVSEVVQMIAENRA